MNLRRFMAATVILLSCLSTPGSHAGISAPPAITLYPDDYPLGVAFFFPSGGPLERFTSRPGAWYAIYRMPLYPGRPYDVLLGHAGDPARMKVYALDNHPFDVVSIKYELNLRRLEFGGRRNTLYGTTISTPPDSAAYGVYLLLEWIPPMSNERPIPVVLQVLSSESGYRQDSLRDLHPSWHGSWQRPWNDLHIESPLQSQNNRNIIVIPLPRSEIWDKDRRNVPPMRLLPY